jgi:hypothetical protein
MKRLLMAAACAVVIAGTASAAPAPELPPNVKLPSDLAESSPSRERPARRHAEHRRHHYRTAYQGGGRVCGIGIPYIGITVGVRC